MTEEATNGDASPPNAKTMSLIAREAFEIDEYVRISDILHTRLATFDRRQWREAYKALLLLDHLLTHGPRSVALEFRKDRAVIQNMATFQHIDEKGFNWGLTVKGKSERVLKLLERGPFLEEERERARKVAREIKGFGSFNLGTVREDAKLELLLLLLLLQGASLPGRIASDVLWGVGPHGLKDWGFEKGGVDEVLELSLGGECVEDVQTLVSVNGIRGKVRIVCCSGVRFV